MYFRGKPFHPSLKFVGKTKSLPKMEVFERCSTQAGSCLTLNYKTRFERPARDKHSSLFGLFVASLMAPWPNVTKLFCP
jgi:hypothetical protein